MVFDTWDQILEHFDSLFKSVCGRLDMNLIPLGSHHWFHLDYENVIFGLGQVYIRIAPMCDK